MKNISKNVVTIENGKKVGYVLDMAFDEKYALIGYYCVDEETEREFFVAKQNIDFVSDSAVFVDDVSKLEFVANRTESLIGKDVFDMQGNFYGTINDIVLMKEKLEKLITDRCEILSKFIEKIGENVVFVSFKRKQRKSKKQPFHKFSSEDEIVKIQEKTLSEIKTPQIVRLSSEYYIGKVSQEDVFGYNNERIILKGEIVSKNTVEIAKKHNRLNQLFFALKK